MSKQKPIHTIRRGNVEAAIWRNTGKEGSYCRATFSRVYKDGEAYKNTASFGPIDAIMLSHVAILACDYMAENGKE